MFSDELIFLPIEKKSKDHYKKDDQLIGFLLEICKANLDYEKNKQLSGV